MKSPLLSVLVAFSLSIAPRAFSQSVEMPTVVDDQITHGLLERYDDAGVLVERRLYELVNDEEGERFASRVRTFALLDEDPAAQVVEVRILGEVTLAKVVRIRARILSDEERAAAAQNEKTARQQSLQARQNASSPAQDRGLAQAEQAMIAKVRPRKAPLVAEERTALAKEKFAKLRALREAQREKETQSESSEPQ